MRKGFLVCFFILSCVQPLRCWALEDPKASKRLMVSEEKQDTNGSGNLNLRASSDDQEFAAKHRAFFPEMAQKGRGSSGSANVIHHPRPNQKNAASILQSPSAFISSNNLGIGFSFILILPLLIA